MPVLESDIIHDNGDFWVLRDKKSKSYTVMKSKLTHSVTDSSYPLNDDGLSLAICRAEYMSKRKNMKDQMK